MKKILMDGNTAGAWGARLSRVEVVPSYPITPQTELIETIAKWAADGDFDVEFIRCESEHSVLSAAAASEAAGARSFTATSSQGLLLMHEMLYICSGMRLPVVMINCSRGLSAPITLWNDHNDILDQRDSGWIIFFCENNQEVVDTVIQAFRIGEDERVSLPVLINLDGYVLSYTREPVELPQQSKVDKFLPRFKPLTALDPKKPMSLGVPVMDEYMDFRLQHHRAALNALDVSAKAFKKFAKIFGRTYAATESYRMDDAEVALVSMGALTSTTKAAVNVERKRGRKVGLLKLRLYRPFPEKSIQRALGEVEAVAVMDQNISPGFGGILYPEIRSVVPEKIVNDYILGLGGRPVFRKTYEDIIADLFKSLKKGKSEVKIISE